MNPQRLLETLSAHGISLTAHDGKLRATAPPGRITPELAAQIRENKPALLALLQDRATRAGLNGGTMNGHGTPNGRGPGGGPGTSGLNAPVTAKLSDRSTGRSRAVPLSVTQVRQAGAARSGNALPIVLRLIGKMDQGALQRSLEYTLTRHAPLRSSFQLDRDPPTQLEHDISTLPLEVTDLSDKPDQENKALALVRELTATPFDVTRPPLMLAHLIRMSDEEHWLFTSFSPLVIDGWSFDVFWQELRTAYVAYSSGEAVPLPALESTYAELSEWQSRRVEERRSVLEAFWKQALGQQLPPLPLPTDYPRPPLSNNRGGNITYALAPEIEAELRRLARSVGSTPQMLMLTAFYVWLHRMSGETELVVAGPAAARLHPASEAVIGPFVNIMLLRMTIEPSATFTDLLSDVRDRCLEAYDHQELPLEQLKVRSAPGAGGSFAPAFQAEFSFQMVSNRDKDMGSLRIEQLELPSGAATNDITMWVKDWGSQIKGAVEYKLELFEPSTIQGWVDCFVHLLGELVVNPSGLIKAAQLLDPKAAEQVRNRLRELDASHVEEALNTPLRGKRVTDIELVDADSNPLPPGCFGRLIVTTEAVTLEAAQRVRLTYDGRLEVESKPVHLTSASTPFRAPTTDLERQLIDILAGLLGDERLGVDHDFFESGGNSLLAVRLFNEIATRTGVRLPFTAILEAPTAARLAMRIKGGAGHGQACLLRLREGDASCAAYFVHDGDGETLLYRNLAERLPPGMPIYGVNPKAKGAIPTVHTSVEAMAEFYASEIRKQQPQGPYIVGGLCAGGVIAYEVARRLAEDGADTKLILLDSAPPFASRKQTALTHRMTQVVELGRMLTGGATTSALRSGLRRLSGGVRYELMYRMDKATSRLQIEAVKRLASSPLPWPAWLPVPTFREIWNYAETRYRGTPTRRVKTILVRATSGHGGDQPSRDILTDPFFDWQQLIQTPIRAIDVPGGHSTMLQLPYVDELSHRLGEEIPRLDEPSEAPVGRRPTFATASA